MVDATKQSAVAAIASDLGASMAHTPAASGDLGAPDLFLAIDDEVEAFDNATIQPAKRGRGRPAGSVSRTTRQLQAYLQARGYRDPAEFLASIVSMSTGELRSALASYDKEGRAMPADGTEVLKVQIRAAEALMPYFHQRQPQQVEVKGDAARPLIMIMGYDGPAAIAASDGSMSVLDLIEDQGVSLPAPAGDANRSHD